MIDETMLKVAEAEVKRLEAELEKTPAYKRLQAAKNLIAVYRGDPEVIADSEAAAAAKPARVRAVLTEPLENEIVPATKTAQVDAAAVEFLVNKGRRATSGEILPFVQAKGIEITGAVPAKTLASYLSRSKRFDNVQGFGGFGLVEWHGRRGPPAPASANNEIVHGGGKLPLNS